MTSKRRHRFIGKLRHQLIAGLSIFLVVIMGASVLLYDFLAPKYYLHQKEKVFDDTFSYLSTLDFADLSDNEQLELYVRESQHSIHILIADEDFNLTYVSGNFNEEAISSAVEYWIIRRTDEYQPNATPTILNGFFSPKASFFCLFNLVTQGSGTYYVCFFEDIQATSNTFRYINQLMVVLLVLTLLGSILYSVALSRYLLSPIERIDTVAGQIADGDLTVRVQQEPCADEIYDLTLQVNRMADTLQNDLNRLENYNAALQRQNQTMESFERLQKQFVSQVTHELKTPLAIISTQAEMLEWTFDEEQRTYYRESILEEVSKMSRMISEVLSLSFDDHRLNQMILERIDISECCRSQIQKYEDWISQHRIRLVSKIDDNCTALFSRLQFEQILNNFVMNACQHTPENGEIRITLNDTPDDFLLCVFNTGTPISDEDRDKIWTGYYHLKSLNHGVNDSDSVGLGLFIVQDIVKAYAGECDFANTPDGVTFWVKLPKHYRPVE